MKEKSQLEYQSKDGTTWMLILENQENQRFAAADCQNLGTIN